MEGGAILEKLEEKWEMWKLVNDNKWKGSKGVRVFKRRDEGSGCMTLRKSCKKSRLIGRVRK